MCVIDRQDPFVCMQLATSTKEHQFCYNSRIICKLIECTECFLYNMVARQERLLYSSVYLIATSESRFLLLSCEVEKWRVLVNPTVAVSRILHYECHKRLIIAKKQRDRGLLRIIHHVEWKIYKCRCRFVVMWLS